MSNLNKSKLKQFLKAIGKPKSFHTANLEHIKKIAKASFVGFEHYQDIYHVRVVRDGKETFYRLIGTPNDMTQDSYDKLLELILLGRTRESVLLDKLGNNDGV